MKLLIINIFLFLLIPIISYSQTKTLDSLKKVYYSNLDSLTAKSYFDNALNSIEREKDDFTNEITIRTDVLKPISITKVINNNKAVYYLSLQTMGSTVNYNIKGVYLLFTDGKKWVKLNESIDIDYDDGFNYSTFIRLTPLELRLFQTKKVDKFKLYIYEQNVGLNDSDKFILQSNYIQIIK
jgi:hypothetical protein